EFVSFFFVCKLNFRFEGRQIHLRGAHHLTDAIVQIACDALALIFLGLNHFFRCEFLLIQQRSLQSCFFLQPETAICGESQQCEKDYQQHHTCDNEILLTDLGLLQVDLLLFLFRFVHGLKFSHLRLAGHVHEAVLSANGLLQGFVSGSCVARLLVCCRERLQCLQLILDITRLLCLFERS